MYAVFNLGLMSEAVVGGCFLLSFQQFIKPQLMGAKRDLPNTFRHQVMVHLKKMIKLFFEYIIGLLFNSMN